MPYLYCRQDYFQTRTLTLIQVIQKPVVQFKRGKFILIFKNIFLILITSNHLVATAATATIRLDPLVIRKVSL